MSFLESNDTSLLFMKINGLVHPFLQGVGDFFHGIDYGGDLDVQSFGKQSSDFRSVFYLKLHNKVLKWREVCLESIIFPGYHLFEVVKLSLAVSA